MGEHEIEHDAIEGLVVHEEEPFLARNRDAYVVALRLESLTQGLGDLLFVLHDQHAHRPSHYIGSPIPPHLTEMMSGILQWHAGRGIAIIAAKA